MIKCKVQRCSYKSKSSLFSHLKAFHKMSASDYKKTYNSSIYSSEFIKRLRKSISKQMKERWEKDTIFREKHLKKLHASGKKISKSLKEKYKNNEIKVWNDGLTKKDDVRVRRLGELNKKRLTGKKNQKQSEWAKRFSVFVTRNPSKFKTESERKLWREKISKTLCEKIAKGELNHPTYHYKNGYYNGKFNLEYYQSGLELEIMKYLDICQYVSYWTKKHKKRVEYVFNNIKRFYYPDFFIKLNTGKIIIVESKGFLTEHAMAKHKSAFNFFSDFFVVFSVEQLHNVLENIGE